MKEIKIYRLSARKYVEGIWSKRETMDCPSGRWNPQGTFICYTSDSAAAATHEMAVHIGFPQVATECSLGVATINENQITVLEESSLGEDWKSNLFLTQAIGQAFIESGDKLVMRVPSAILPYTYNYLLNSNHPDFENMVSSVEPDFFLDLRVLRE